jgi:hypothetical protein
MYECSEIGPFIWDLAFDFNFQISFVDIGVYMFFACSSVYPGQARGILYVPLLLPLVSMYCCNYERKKT